MEIFKTLSLQQWVILGAFLTTLLPIAAGFRSYRYLSRELRLLFWFCVSSFLLDAVSRIFWILSLPNLFIGHVSTLSEFLFLAGIYRIALRGFIARWIVPVIMIGFSALAVINTLFLQSYKFNNSNIKILESFLLIIFSLLFLVKLIHEMKVIRLEKYPMFWVNCAVLIFYSSTLFIFIYSNYLLLYSKELAIHIWFIHAVFFILFYIVLFLSLWITPRSSNLPG